MEDELTYYVYYRGSVAEYGYGPDFVATMMWMDDYPKFYSKQEAKDYWEKVQVKEFNNYRGCKDNQTPEDNPTHEQSCRRDGSEADGAAEKKERAGTEEG